MTDEEIVEVAEMAYTLGALRGLDLNESLYSSLVNGIESFRLSAEQEQIISDVDLRMR